MINSALILKPGIILGNLITFTAGFFFARGGEWPPFFAGLFGLACVVGASCILNNYFDRDMDQKMERTKRRPLVGVFGLLLAAALLCFGNLFLYLYTNLLVLFLTDLGFFIYVFIYTFLKKSTVHATAIGSIAGALPPVIGYACAGQGWSLPLFLFLFFWQMPHFFAIALYRLKDYAHADIPVLPLARGVRRTKVEMFVYIVACVVTLALIVPLAVPLGLWWLWLSVKGFAAENQTVWGRQMFLRSLFVINGACLLIIVRAAVG